MIDPLIPSYLNLRLKLAAKDLEQLVLPYRFTEEAGILNTDICSFTKITEQVSAKGHYGVEIITGILNSYFETMIGCIHANGGCLLKYGGDSMFALFPGSPETAIPRILNCREQMYEQLKDLNASFQDKYGHSIIFDGAIKYGQINLCIVGDAHHHLDYFVDGEVVRELFELGAVAPEGQIVCGAEILPYQDYPLIPNQCEAEQLVIAGDSFIPVKVQHKIQEKGFSAELRNTAVIFVHISNREGGDQLNIQDYHHFYVKLQHLVYDLDGTINKIDFTDKGYLVLITFGTPYNHIDDIERAFTCAYRIRNIPSESLAVKIGITYSNIYAGILGASTRYEYGIIGNAVNIAARLMSNSRAGEISFSEDILSKVTSRFESVFVDEVPVKGIRKPLRIHKIIGELPDSWYSMHGKYADKMMVCHNQEIAQIQNELALGKTPYVILAGPAGTGKSFLAYQIMLPFKTTDTAMDIYVMEEYNQNKQCSWLNSVLSRHLMVFDLIQDLALLEDFCLKQKLDFDLKLLKQYFMAMRDSDIELNKNEFEIIYNQLSDIVSLLLQSERILFIDDIQWMDSSSQQVFTRTLSGLLKANTAVIISSRAILDYITPMGLDNPRHQIAMQNLDPEPATAIIKAEIPVVSEDAISSIYKMTKGNPLFMVEMTKVIRDNIDVENSILAESDLRRLEKEGIISNTIENLLINEYENLESDAQKMLKIASIIGKAFALEELNMVSKATINSDYQEIIQDLSTSHIIGQKTFNPGIEYVFNNHLMRDAIYRTILLGEKKELHEKMAKFYEDKYASNLHPWLELIANHYIFANSPQKALQYAILSGEKTARLAAYPESNYYYEKALSFCQDSLQCYHIRLAMIKNEINQGDGNMAWKLLRELEQKYPQHLNDDFYLQQARILTLKGMYKESIELIPKTLPLIHSEAFKNSIRLRYMDALNFLNRMVEFHAEAAILQQALADSTDFKLKGDFLITMAQMHLNRSEYAQATDYYQQLRNLAEKSSDQIHLRIAFNGLGITASRTGDNATARKYYELSLSICERLGDRNGYAKLIMDLGTLLRNDGDIEGAIILYHKSRNTAESIGNTTHQSAATYNIGEAYYYLHQFDEALKYLQESLELSESIGDLSGKTYCYDAMGDIHFQSDELDEAEEIYNANLLVQQELNDKEGIAHTIGNLANVASRRGRIEQAVELYQQQMDILGEVGDLNGMGRAYYNRAMIYLDNGDKAASISNLQQALKLFEQCQAQIFIDLTREKLNEILDSPDV